MNYMTLLSGLAYVIATAGPLAGSPIAGDLPAADAVTAAPKEPPASLTSSISLSSNGLSSGERLSPGDFLKSSDGRYRFILQNDGNLVLYNPFRPLWASGTNGIAIASCIMQTDGNLVLYGYDGRARWASNTAGHGGAYLIVQSDGNVVIYQGTVPIWATGTNE